MRAWRGPWRHCFWRRAVPRTAGSWRSPKTPAQAARPILRDAGASAAEKSGGAADLKNPLTIAQLCGSHGQTAEAKRLYEEVIQRHPKDPAGYHGLALLYAKQGQFKEAEPCFTRALALAPDRADLLGDMGYFCYLCSRSQEAERYLRRALELEPNEATYGNNLALVLGEQGRDKESLDLFRRFGTEEQAYTNMAFVYAQRGDYAKALETYDRVLTADPKDRTAAIAMLQLRDCKTSGSGRARRSPASLRSRLRFRTRLQRSRRHLRRTRRSGPR